MSGPQIASPFKYRELTWIGKLKEKRGYIKLGNASLKSRLYGNYRALKYGVLLCSGILLLPILTATASPTYFQQRQKVPVSQDRSTLGKVMDSLPAYTETGEKINLAQVTKGWKVIYFWSSTCPCVRTCQTLTLFPLARAFKDRDVAFYAVASNPSDFAVKQLTDGSKRAFLRLGDSGQFPPFPTVIDTDRSLANQLKARSAAQTFVLDSKNRVVFCGDPDDAEEVRQKTGRRNEKTRDYLADALNEGLAGKNISRPAAPLLGCDLETPITIAGGTSGKESPK